MKIVMYGNSLGIQGAMTEVPFLLNGKIIRIYKDASELQDLEADIAIANFTQEPNFEDPESKGWNYLRLPKVKVQLAIQAEHFDEYIPKWVDGITHNFDGSICYDFNRPFWEFDDSIHDCFARSYWEEIGAPIKPRFYFDPFVKWNYFYPGAGNSFLDYGCVMGSVTEHRDQIVKGNKQFKYVFGDVRDYRIVNELIKSGIGINIHKFDIKGKHPETDGKETKAVAKTEAIRLAFYYNLGMAVVTEQLDKTFPERMRDCIIEVDEMSEYKINKEELYKQVIDTQRMFESYHDLNYEIDNLINNIKKEYNL